MKTFKIGLSFSILFKDRNKNAGFLSGLQEKVDAKLDELLKIDIIEEVSGGPSGRTSPLVVVSKGDSDVRVCVE